jgi:hypothetical protein
VWGPRASRDSNRPEKANAASRVRTGPDMLAAVADAASAGPRLADISVHPAGFAARCLEPAHARAACGEGAAVVGAPWVDRARSLSA